MPSSILLTGGCRSGKSSRALKIAESLQKAPCLFLATCEPSDDEMRARVKRHQQERGSHWQVLETPVEITQAIVQHADNVGVMLIDCLTLWISNLMASGHDDDHIFSEVNRLGRVVAQPPCPIIMVSNEVGCGVVPANALSRRFRDLVGWTNQHLAQQVQQVIWMVSGIPVPIKPSPFSNSLAGLSDE